MLTPNWTNQTTFSVKQSIKSVQIIQPDLVGCDTRHNRVHARIQLFIMKLIWCETPKPNHVVACMLCVALRGATFCLYCKDDPPVPSFVFSPPLPKRKDPPSPMAGGSSQVRNGSVSPYSILTERVLQTFASSVRRMLTVRTARSEERPLK